MRKSMGKVSKKELQTAFHEAGHAMVSFLLDRKIRMVTIIPNHKIGYSGVVKMHWLKDFRPDCYVDQRHRMKAEVEIMICLAGGIAQARYQRKRWSWKCPGTGHDVETIFKIADFFAEGKTLDAWLKYLIFRVTDMLKAQRNWRLVGALAHELAKKKRMTGAEVHRFILEIREAEFQKHLKKEGRAPCPPFVLVGGQLKPAAPEVKRSTDQE